MQLNQLSRKPLIQFVILKKALFALFGLLDVESELRPDRIAVTTRRFAPYAIVPVAGL